MAISPTTIYTQTKQEFLNSVVNKIGRQEFSNKTYKNPLSRIKGGFIDGASDIEEIYVERTLDTGYDKEGTGLADRSKPVTKVQYHTNSVEHGYKTTVHNKQMRKGFLTKEALGTMANSIVNALHTGQELDDYQDCLDVLKALASAPIESKDNVITIAPVKDEATAKIFTKEVKKAVNKMMEYGTVYSDVGSYAKPEELILFVDSDIDVELQIELLATTFNKSVSELNECTKMVIPNMTTKVGCMALICHEKCLKLNPLYYDLDTFKNTRGKFVNYDLVTETLQSYTTWFPHAIVKATV